jgi:RNA polymerase sigma factor (TIGR02999 family)
MEHGMCRSLDAEDGAVEGAGPPVLDELFADAYEQLRRRAGIERRRWRGNHTLNTTALVHEVYVKLSGERAALRNPDRLLAVAARAMRHVLVNYAEEQRAAKRGGDAARVTLATLDASEGDAGGSSTWDEVLVLNSALDRLGESNARQRDVVECRFFGGLSVEETSAALEISTATVKRDWRFARTWLYRELAPASPGEGGAR